MDKILEEQENWIRAYGKGRFTEGQIEFSKTYVEDEFANKLRKIGIDPETITIKK